MLKVADAKTLSLAVTLLNSSGGIPYGAATLRFPATNEPVPGEYAQTLLARQSDIKVCNMILWEVDISETRDEQREGVQYLGRGARAAEHRFRDLLR